MVLWDSSFCSPRTSFFARINRLTERAERQPFSADYHSLLCKSKDCFSNVTFHVHCLVDLCISNKFHTENGRICDGVVIGKVTWLKWNHMIWSSQHGDSQGNGSPVESTVKQAAPKANWWFSLSLFTRSLSLSLCCVFSFRRLDSYQRQEKFAFVVIRRENSFFLVFGENRGWSYQSGCKS